MKFFVKLILVILYIPVFLIFIFAVNLRFQLLTPSFWDKTFISGGTYTKLSLAIKANMESQAVAAGGRASDVNILTNLITPENLRDAITKNIDNILIFANGKGSEIMVYIPVNKIPEWLLSTNFNIIKTETSLPDLLKEFNVSGISDYQIQLISRAGFYCWLIFGIASFLMVLLFGLLYLTVDFGKRLVAPGMALVLSGAVALSIRAAAIIIQTNWAKDLAGRSNVGDSIIGIVVPPIIQAISSVWLYFAVCSLVLGFVLFFVKKPGYGRIRRMK